MLSDHRARMRAGLPLIAFTPDSGSGSGGGTATPATPAEPTTATEPTTTTADDDDDDAPLGPKGEKALAAMKAELKTAKAKAKLADDLQAQLDAIQAANMSDQDKAIKEAADKAAADARTSVLADVNGRMFKSELRAATAGKLLAAAAQDLLVDPTVALKLLELDEVPVTPSGDVDSEAISQAVDAYVAARPHLAATATGTPGSIDQGARPTTTQVETLDEQIVKAEKANDWDLARRLKLQKLAAK